MPQYGIPPTDRTTPAWQMPDPIEVAQLLATLAAIPTDQLSEERDRHALAMYIEAGYVDNLYRPLGDPQYNIAWRTRPDVDPRQRVVDWVAERRAYDLEWQRRHGR